MTNISIPREALKLALEALESMKATLAEHDEPTTFNKDQAITAIKEALEQPEQEPQPPFGSKRAAAMALYKPPFAYSHGYICDAAGETVADQDGSGGAVETGIAARVRGWGRLVGYLPDGAALQDEVGRMMAEALTHLYTTPPKREWVGLTDEEIRKIVDENTEDDQGYDIWCNGMGVARAIEAKLKETNA